MSKPRPRSKVKNPGVFQARVLRILAEHGQCTASRVNYLIPGNTSVDACDRALEGLFRMEFVKEMDHGALPSYGLTDKGIVWLDKEDS
jgi:predicted transcriptional regulator